MTASARKVDYDVSNVGSGRASAKSQHVSAREALATAALLQGMLKGLA